MNFNQYFNAKAFEANASGNYLNAFGTELFAGQDGNFANAAANNRPKVSAAFRIKIQNTTTIAVANVVIGNAISIISGSASLTTGVAYTTNTGTAYKDVLMELFQIPKRIGKTRFSATTSPQLDETYTVKYTSQSGQTYSDTLILERDEYAQDSTIMSIEQEYDFNPSTTITISNLLASESLTLGFYPTTDRNIGNLRGNDQQEYSEPRINKVMLGARR